MPNEVTIYHNSRCTKSRQTLELLRSKGVEPAVVEYLKTPPDAKTLDGILKMLGVEPMELMRKEENEFKQLGLDKSPGDRKALIKAMVEHPVLIERPIVVKGGKARVGRPPEKVLEIL